MRRSCSQCVACNEGAPDSCLTGDYSERGITRLHGFARELVAEDPAQLIAIPSSLGRLGVLVEPASICERGIRHARAIGGRQPWELRRALVIGTGAIGMLSTYLLRLGGLDVWTAGRSLGRRPAAAVGERVGCALRLDGGGRASDAAGGGRGFDLVVEATGDAQVMADSIGLLRRNGVACLLGLDARRRAVELDGRVIGVDAVVENRTVFGSVNAHRVDWLAAVESLERVQERWPTRLQQFVGLRVRSTASRRRSATPGSRPRSCSRTDRAASPGEAARGAGLSRALRRDGSRTSRRPTCRGTRTAPRRRPTGRS